MRLNKRTGSPSSSPSSSGVALNPSTYGLDGFPDFDPDALPGDDVRERARAYVDALDLNPSVRRGMLLFRVECLIEDHERERDGRPSYEEEILASVKEEE